MQSSELDGHLNSIDQLGAENDRLAARLAAEVAKHKTTREELRKQRQVTDIIKQLLNDKQRRSICVDGLLDSTSSAGGLSGSEDDDYDDYDDTSSSLSRPTTSSGQIRSILKERPLRQVALVQGSSNLGRRSSSRLAAMMDSSSSSGSSGSNAVKAPYSSNAKQYYPEMGGAADDTPEEVEENNYVDIDAYQMNQRMPQSQQYHTPTAGSHAGTPHETPVPSAPSEPFSLYARPGAAAAAPAPAAFTPGGSGGNGTPKMGGKTPKSTGKKRKQSTEISARQRRHMLKESSVITRSRCAKCMANIGSRVKHNQCTQCSRRYHAQCALDIPCDCRPPAFGGKQSRDAPPIGSNLQATIEDEEQAQAHDGAASGLNIPSIVNDVIAAVDRRG